MNVLLNKKWETEEEVITEIVFLNGEKMATSSLELRNMLTEPYVKMVIDSFHSIADSLKRYDHTIALTNIDENGNITFEFKYSTINKEEVFRKLSSKIKGMCKSVFNARVNLESVQYEVYPK